MFKKMLLLLIVLAMPMYIFAQSSGKIIGVVKDKDTGEPLPGVNVFLQDTYIGSTTDVDGYFVLLNVPVGTFNLEISYVGYQSTVFENIRVSAGVTTEQNASLAPTTLELGETVVVTAERPLVEKHVTQSISKVTGEDLASIPVRGTQDILAIQASVVVQDGNVHIRGGRASETGYYVDGAATMDPVSRTNAVHVIQESVEEIQVLTGGYTAEFGDANSGIVRTDMKTGGSDYHISFDAQTDKFVDSGEEFLGTTSYREHILSLTASGPIVGKNIRFFVAAENQDIGDTVKRRSTGYEFNDLIDTSPLSANVAAGNPDTVKTMSYPDGYTPRNEFERWSINSTLLFDYNPYRFRVSAIYNWSKDYTDNTPMLSALNTREQALNNNQVLLSGKFTHVLNPTTYYDVNLSYYYDTNEMEDDWFGTDWQSWQDSAKVSDYTGGRVTYQDKWTEDYNYLLNGFPFQRDGTVERSYYKDEQTYVGGSFDLVSQLTKNHEVKVGMNARKYTIRRYQMDPAVMSTTEQYGSIENVPDQRLAAFAGNTYGYDLLGNETDDGFDGAKEPFFFAGYIQDKIEYKDLIVNVGLRYDYFYTDDRVLKNPDNPDVDPVTNQVKFYEWEKKDAMTFFSPRLGISFPVSEKTVFYTQYGIFYQLPQLNDFYYGSWSYASQIGSGGYYYINPVGYDLDEQKTTSYEVGFRQQLGDFASFDISGFYKNIEGQVQVGRTEAAAGSDISTYLSLTNGDFATTKGLEFKLTMRRFNRLQAQFNYTLTDAEGVGSNETSYMSAVYNVSETPKTLNPLDYSQTHRGSVNLDYRFGKGDGGKVFEQSGMNMLFNFSSGHSYTYVYFAPGGQVSAYDAGIDYMLDTRTREALEPVNSSTTAWTYTIDLYMDKSFDLMEKLKATLYMRVTNLFDTKNTANVFPATGNAEDDGFLYDRERSQTYIDKYGGQDYIDMYQAINLDNGQAYWDATGNQLYDQPRQIFFGIKLNY